MNLIFLIVEVAPPHRDLQITLAHRDVDGNILVEENVLPADRPVTVGVTSGASTPDSVVQECLERLVLLKNLMPEAV